jgi:hypothetical protein
MALSLQLVEKVLARVIQDGGSQQVDRIKITLARQLKVAGGQCG